MEIATAFVAIRPQTDGFESELAAAVGGQQVDVPLTADTSEVEGALDAVSGEEVEVAVGADTSDAEGAIDSIDAQPVDVPVTADTSGAEESIGGLSDQVSELVGGLGGGGGGGAAGALDAFSGAAIGAGGASSIAATGGLTALAAGLGYAVSEGSEAQVTLAQLEQMVTNMGANAGVTSQGLQQLATGLQETAGFSDEAVMSGEAVVLMFENVRNTAGQPIFDRTIQSSADLARSPAFNGDITSAARTLGRALDDPVAGMSRLRRAGIQLTAAQEETIRSLQESGDLEGAQAALLDIVDSKVGGLAETYAGTYAGALDRAKESVGEAAEAMGAQMLPALEAVSESVIDQVQRLNSWDQALNGALLSGPVQAIAETLGAGTTAIEAQGEVVEGSSTAWAGATQQIDAYAEAQTAAQSAVSGTLPTLGGVISETDRAGEAFGILNASSNPQVIIDNLGMALFAWDDFQANITSVAQWGPNIAAALQQLGPQVAGGLTNALAEGNAATIVQLDTLIAEIQARGGDASAVLTGFARTGMAGAVAAVDAASGPMGAAGTAAGASGAAGIDAGLAFSNASAIGAIVGVQYGSGVSSGIASMAGTVSAVANNLIAGAGSASAAYSRGQSIGSSYGAGLVAGLAGQIGNAGATAASLRRAADVESVGAGITRTSLASLDPGPRQPVQVVIDGRVIAETSFEYGRRISIAEGYEP